MATARDARRAGGRSDSMTAPDISAILLDALDDERKAQATYAAVIAAFGPVRPFINIIEAEGRHAAAIMRQLHRLGIAIPADRWAGRVAAPASLAAACEAAIEAEIENIALYDRLIPAITDPDIRGLLERLQAASRENHLPAFRRCLTRRCGRSADDRQRQRPRPA